MNAKSIGLLNLRGSDIPYNPVFFSWAVIKSNNQVHLFVDTNKITHAVREHLNLESDVVMRDGSDSNNNILAVLHPYDAIDSFLRTEVKIFPFQIFLKHFSDLSHLSGHKYAY